MKPDGEQDPRAPREEIRAVNPGVFVRAAGDGEDDDSPPILFGHFARFDEWTEIDSWFEGRFMERIARGAFKKTMKEGRDQIRVLLQHGHDPSLGEKPIAEPQILREDDEGAYYEARLFDGVPEIVMDGLRAGQYGASFRFSVMREEMVEDPGTSDHNPQGLPERTLKELRVHEFGPVTWGAYPTATAGVRSLTDRFVFDWIVADPSRARALTSAADLSRAAFAPGTQDQQDDAPSTSDAAQSRTSGPERRVTASGHGPLALPVRTERTGLNLNTPERGASWPLR